MSRRVSSEPTELESFQMHSQMIRNARHIALYDLLVIEDRLYNVFKRDGKVSLIDVGSYPFSPGKQASGIMDELVADIINDFCSNIEWGVAHFEQEQAEADVRDTLERYFRKRAGLTDPQP